MSISETKNYTFQPLSEAADCRYIARGAAADIWLTTSPNQVAEQRVLKVLRVDSGCFIEDPVEDQAKSHSIEHSFGLGLDFGLDVNQLAFSHPNKGKNVVPRSEAHIVRPLWESFVEEYRKKVQAWALLDHKNVVQVFGLGDGLNLEVQYYENGCVRDYLKSNREVDKVIMARDVLAGIAYLHTRNPPIIHGSINAGKLFVNRQGKTLVGEFGLTVLCQPVAAHVPAVSFSGFSRWLSPEIVMNVDGTAHPTVESDIWALGCTLYEILVEKWPYFKHKHEIKIRREIAAGKHPGRPDESPSSPTADFLWLMIKECWALNGTDRPAASALLQVPVPDCESNIGNQSHTPASDHVSEGEVGRESSMCGLSEDEDSANRETSLERFFSTNFPHSLIDLSGPQSGDSASPRGRIKFHRSSLKSPVDHAPRRPPIPPKEASSQTVLEDATKSALGSSKLVQSSPSLNLSWTPFSGFSFEPVTRDRTYSAQLQEWADKNRISLRWEFNVLSPSNRPIFLATPTVNGQRFESFTGSGTTKQDAKNEASRLFGMSV